SSENFKLPQTTPIVRAERDNLGKGPVFRTTARRCRTVGADNNEPAVGKDCAGIGELELGVEVYPQDRRNPFVCFKLPPHRAAERLRKFVQSGRREFQERELRDFRVLLDFAPIQYSIPLRSSREKRLVPGCRSSYERYRIAWTVGHQPRHRFLPEA